MDSQGYAWMARARVMAIGGLCTAAWARYSVTPLRAVLVLLALLCWNVAAIAQQSSNYAYDANGRLVGVTQNDNAAQYSYDANGNLLQISSVGAGQVAIFSFLPTHGASGTQVVISGKGFASTPAGNAVAFNGAGATVLSASTNQLVVTVPNGATTGPISVTAGTQTAVSSSPFVVDNTGLPPIITQVSPGVAAAGSVLTTAGSHLYPVTGETTLQVAGQQMQLIGALDTQLQSSVPVNASSGYVSVQTPYGKARSLAPVVVVPANINAANVVSTGYVSTAGQTASISIPAANQVGAVLFDGTVGSWLSLQGSAITTTSSAINFTVYAPGNVVLQTGTISATAPSIHLSQLPSNGTYLVTFTPTTAAAQMTLSLEANTVLDTSQPLSVTTPGGWQSKRLLINTLVGQDLELTFNGVAVTGIFNPVFTVYVYTAAGVQVGSFSCRSSDPGASCLKHLWQSSGGMYTVYVVPAGVGAMSFNALLRQDAKMPIAIGGAQPLTLMAGQVQRFTFTGQAGQLLALQTTASTTPSVGGVGVALQVYRPDVGPITSATAVFASADTANGSVINLPALPVNGTYTVVATPDYGLAVTGQMQLLQSATGGLTTNGPAIKLAASGPNQNVYFTFAATQSEDLELTLNQLTIVGNTSANVYVYNAAGVLVTSTTCFASSPAGSCMLNLWGMWAGTYTVVVSQAQGGPISFNALVQDVIKGGSLQIGTPQPVNLSAGQVEKYTFNANAGDTLAVNLSNIVTTPASQPVTIYVYRPEGGAIYASTRTDSIPTVNLPNLPISGAYTVAVVPSYGLPMTAQITVQPGLVGTLAIGSPPISFTSPASGQLVYMNFVAQAGDNIELVINHIAITGSNGTGINFTVFDSNGTNVASVLCNPTTVGTNTVTSCSQHLWNLAPGKYRIIATPYSGYGMMSFDAQIQRDLVGPALTVGNTVSANLSLGQVERFTFNANAGDTVALLLANVATTPQIYSNGVQFFIYRPDAGVITTSTSVYSSINMAGTTTINLPNLPVGGAYTVIMAPVLGMPANAQLTLYGGSAGTLPNTGAQQSMATNVSGQNSYLTFTAQAGDNLELTLNGVTINGGTATAVVNVYNVAGTPIASFYCAQSNPNSSCMQPLWNLVAGTYTVIVSPYSGGKVTFNAMIEPDIVGSPMTTPGYEGFLLNAGQAQRTTFVGHAGDTINLLVQNQSTWPAGNSVNFAVYRPDTGAFTQTTTSFTSFSVNTGTKSVTLPVLPVTGTYSLVVMPQYGLQGAAQVTLTDAAASPPSYGTATLTKDGMLSNQQSSGAGQSVTMTFNANEMDNLELTLSAINVPGATTNGFRVDVYDPAGKQANWSYCYASNPGSTCRLALWNLFAGTYKVVASPTWGGTMSFAAQVEPDVIGPSLAPNTPVAVNLPQGSVQRLTFNANAGDTVALALSAATTVPAGQPVSLAVYRPDTGFVSTAYVSTSTTSSTAINLPNLPASGTYTVAIFTAYGEPGNANVSLLGGIVPTLVKDAPAQTLATSVASQNVYATFDASQGDNVELSLGNLQATNGASISAQLQILGPNGAYLTGGTCSTTSPAGSCRAPLWNLARGRYSVLVSPTSAVQMSFIAQLKSDTTGPSLTANTPVNVNLGFGEVQRLTFAANAGDTAALSLSNVTTAPSGKTVYLTCYRPDTGASCGQISTTGPKVLNLRNLPVSGNYVVIVNSDYAEPAQMTVTLLPGITGVVTVGTLSPTYGTSVNGQNAYLTFSANPGDNVELGFVNNTGYSITANVYDSNNVQINTFTCSATSPGASCVVPLWNLAGGNYSIVVSSSYGAYSFNALIKPDTIEPPLVLNAPVSVNMAQGEVQRYTFSANQGDDLALSLSSVTTTPSGQNVCAYVFRPDGGAFSPGYNGNAYAQTCSGNGQTVNMSNLPVTGTYTIALMTSASGSPTKATLVVGSGLDGTLATDGAAQTFAAAQTDEKYYVTFHSNPGDNLELSFSGVSVPGNTFTSGIALQLLDANGKAATTYGGCDESSVCMYSLWNLAGGNYRAIISPDFHGLLNFNVRLNSDIIGPLLDPSSPTAFSIPQGRLERFTFNASAGQSFALALSPVSITPSNTAVFVNVYRPDGGAIAMNNYGSQATSNYYAQLQTSATGGILNLPSLPMSGTYTVIAYAYGGTPFTGQLALSTALNTSLVVDGNGQMAAMSAGSRSYLNFSANPGDNLELAINTAGGNGVLAVSVYDPSGKNVINYSCSAQAPGGSCNQPLWNLAAGTYAVVISGPTAGTVQAEAMLKRDVLEGSLTINVPTLVGPTTDPVQRYSFNANAGDNVALQLANITTSPASQPVSVYVYRPDAGTITPANAYAQTSANSSGTLSLPNLPISGTYTVIVSQSSGLPLAASLSLISQ